MLPSSVRSTMEGGQRCYIRYGKGERRTESGEGRAKWKTAVATKCTTKCATKWERMIPPTNPPGTVPSSQAA